MTFTEAAIEVLRREGKPLHFRKIAEIAIRESLLDHVGKIPEEVMAGQLANQCRLPPADRKVAVVQAGTFALAEWGLDEDPAGLDGLVEPPADDELPYRGKERHPTPSRDLVRAAGRSEGRGEGRSEGRPRRREEGDERRGRRYPPPAEVAYEILAGAEHGLPLSEIAAQGAERLLMPDVFVREVDALAAALLEDNRRRESAGRKPLFAIDGELVTLAAQPEPGERAAAPLATARQVVGAAELRKSALLALRRRLSACDGPTVEHVVAKLLAAAGLRELKVAKRGRDHVVYTGRRRIGLADVRHYVRVIRTGAEAGRREVSDLRRDVGNYGAQVGVLASPGEASREARSEATAPGQLPVILLVGEALAEALTEHTVGCRPVVVPEIDEEFFQAATDAAQLEEAARRARREERDRREGEQRGRRDGADQREAGEDGEQRGEAGEQRRDRQGARSAIAGRVVAGANGARASTSAARRRQGRPVRSRRRRSGPGLRASPSRPAGPSSPTRTTPLLWLRAARASWARSRRWQGQAHPRSREGTSRTRATTTPRTARTERSRRGSGRRRRKGRRPSPRRATALRPARAGAVASAAAGAEGAAAVGRQAQAPASPPRALPLPAALRRRAAAPPAGRARWPGMAGRRSSSLRSPRRRPAGEPPVREPPAREPPVSEPPTRSPPVGDPPPREPPAVPPPPSPPSTSRDVTGGGDG